VSERPAGDGAQRRRPRVRDYVADPAHGPLPGLLLILTAVTGLVDAVSILSLGRVFVANMTGNVVFVGFALAGAPGFSLAASLYALAGFLLGALAGGNLVVTRSRHRGSLVRNAAAVECGLLAVTLIVTVLAGPPLGAATRDAVAGLAAVALGVQNAAVQRLAVPDLTTTVLTRTLTGIAADARTGDPSVALRRVLAVATMLLGAVVGALLVLHVSVAWALAVPTILLGAVAALGAGASRRAAPWQTWR
jgi:uncharacterized membrane protein YoaK (UPF0700 family)